MLIAENSTSLTGTATYRLQNITEAPTMTSSTESENRAALMGMAVLSDDQVEMARQIQVPLKYVFIVIAVSFALCNIIIFSRKDMRSTSVIYILGLNVGQLFYVVSYAVYDVWGALDDKPFKHLLYCLYGSYVVYFGGVFAQRASYVVLCLASIERLYAVLRPLHVKSFLLCRHPKVCVLFVYAVCAAWHAVAYLPSTHVIMVMECKIIPTQLYFENRFFYAFGTAGRIIFTYLCLALQLLLSVLTIWALRRHNITAFSEAGSAKYSSVNEDAKKQQERQLTIILLCVSLSYVALSLPSALYNIFVTTFPEFNRWGKYSNLYIVVSDLSYNMTVLGCGVDFCCYLSLSSKFRAAIVGIFRCRYRKQASQTLPTEVDGLPA